jgi:uncharacterized protein YjbI with pentapeptide repeats
MATTQELLDLKYGRQLLEDRARLSELFSEEILGSAYNQNRNTLEGILNIEMISAGWTNAKLKGLGLLSKLKGLYMAGSAETELNIRSLTDLEYLHVEYSGSLASIGNLLYLTKLKEINIMNTAITSIGELVYNVNLISINASNSNLTSANMNYTALETVNFQNAKFNQAAVDKVLSDAATAKSNGSPLETLTLDGANMAVPTNGANNSAYKGLRDYMNVTVTIRTS